MSDLVENPEDTFLCDAAKKYKLIDLVSFALIRILVLLKYELYYKKTCLTDLRPGHTQTLLCSHRK